MLHLQARVHFQEIEAAVGIHQKLDRAGIVVARGAGRANRRLAHLVAHFRMQRHQRRWALLDHLLMPPLDGAFALAQVNHVAVPVAEQLDLDVPRALDQLFHIDLGAAESALRFARGVAERGLQFALAIHPAHAFAAAAGHRLQQHRVAVRGGELAQRLPA